MLVEIGVVLAMTIPVMLLGKAIAIQLSHNSFFVAAFQAVLGGASGYAVATVFTFSVPIVVAGVTIAPLTITMFAVIDKHRQKRKTLSGDYGEEAQWAAEIANSGDREFQFAVQALPQRELREIGIIAESKEELRELTIERFDEVSDDGIPNDFAQ